MAKMRIMKFTPSMAKKKKAAFLSLGMLFIGIVLVAHAVLLGRNAQQAEELVAQLAVLDRVYDLDASLQKSIREIFSAKSGIAVSMANASMSFVEAIPNLQASALNATMRSFEAFVESKIPAVNISSDAILAQLPLLITPLSINYTHSNFGGRDIRMNAQQQNFNGLNINIILNKNVTGCVTEFEGSGTLNFSYSISGPDGNACSGYSQIQWDEESKIKVNGEDLQIELEDGSLSIEFRIEELTGEVNTTIFADFTGATALAYPPALVAISESAAYVHKDSSVTLMRLPS